MGVARREVLRGPPYRNNIRGIDMNNEMHTSEFEAVLAISYF